MNNIKLANDYLFFLNSLNYNEDVHFYRVEYNGDTSELNLKGFKNIASLIAVTETESTYEIDIRFAWDKIIFSQNLIDYYSYEFNFLREQNLLDNHLTKKVIIYLCQENIGTTNIKSQETDRRFIISNNWNSVEHIYLDIKYAHPFVIPESYLEKSLESSLLDSNSLLMPSPNANCKEGGLRLKGVKRTNSSVLPLMSVITVVRNGEVYIEQTIQSVINQSYENIEYIIIDGCSSDNTLEIVKKYEDKIDYWISAPDDGLSDAMNRGVDLAEGAYISHLHADDFFLNHSLVESVVSKIISDPSDWYTGLNLSVDYSGNILNSDVATEYKFQDMLVANIIKHPGTFIEKDKFLAIKFSSRYKYAMDYFFFLNLWKKFGPPVVLKDINVVFRIHSNSLSSNYLRSLNSEMKARLDFRRQERELLFIPLDVTIYLLRVIKTFVYHYPKLLLRSTRVIK